MGIQNAKVYAYRGGAFLGMNNFAQAEKDCEAAHNLDPQLNEALFWLASAKRGGGDWKGVMKCSTKVRGEARSAATTIYCLAL